MSTRENRLIARNFFYLECFHSTAVTSVMLYLLYGIIWIDGTLFGRFISSVGVLYFVLYLKEERLPSLKHWWMEGFKK